MSLLRASARMVTGVINIFMILLGSLPCLEQARVGSNSRPKPRRMAALLLLAWGRSQGQAPLTAGLGNRCPAGDAGLSHGLLIARSSGPDSLAQGVRDTKVAAQLTPDA